MSMPPVRFLKIDVGRPGAARATLERALCDRHVGRLPGILEVEAAIGKAAGRRPRFKAEVTMVFKGFSARAEERDPRLGAAIRRAVEKAAARVRRVVGKMTTAHRQRPGLGHLQPGPEPAPAVARRKSIALTPMAEEEALALWELSGHDFFLYLGRTGSPRVLYRRLDGTVGLLEGVGEPA